MSEALEIYNSEAEILMNSGAEWRAGQGPRAAAVRQRPAWNWRENLWKNQVWKNFEFYENLSTVYGSKISAWKGIIYETCCWFNSEIICSIEMFYGMNQTVTAAFAAPPPNIFIPNLLLSISNSHSMKIKSKAVATWGYWNTFNCYWLDPFQPFALQGYINSNAFNPYQQLN